MTYQIRVCGLIRREPSDVLVVRERMRGEERLNLPGGVPHYGESLPAAMVREVFEETGYEVVPKGIAFVAEQRLARWDDVQLTICFFTEVVRPAEAPPQSEVLSIGWLSERSEKLLATIPEIAHIREGKFGYYVSRFEALKE